MSNLNNPKNVIGMGNILADDDEDIDIDEIERSITSGIMPKKKEDKNIDMAKEYSKEIEELSRRFRVNNGSQSKDDDSDDDDDGKPAVSWSPYNKPSQYNSAAGAQSSNLYTGAQSSYNGGSSNGVSGDRFNDKSNMVANKSNSYKPPYNLDDDSDDESPTQTDRPEWNLQKSAPWSSQQPNDEQLNNMTNEQRKQEKVDRVLNDVEKNNDDADFVKKEEEEDEMIKIIEQIDTLRSGLHNDGEDVSRIPEVTITSSKKEARNVLKLLQYKHDRSRYSSFFNEGIIALAYGLENIFDGNREIFGSKIDLTGYSDSVKVNLKKSRYDTGNFISGVMRNTEMGPGWRVLLSLIPGLLTYSRDRRFNGKDNLISDETYKKAMQDLN